MRPTYTITITLMWCVGFKPNIVKENYYRCINIMYDFASRGML